MLDIPSSRTLATTGVTVALLSGAASSGGHHDGQRSAAGPAVMQTRGGPSDDRKVCAGGAHRAADGPRRGQDFVEWARAKSGLGHVAQPDGHRRSLRSLLEAARDEGR